MSYYGGGGQNGGNRGGAGGNPPQTTLLTGPQLFVNSASQLQFQTGGGQNYFPQGEGSQQSHVQLNTGGGLLLQPPVNFVTDGLGVGISQLITQGSIMNLGNVLMTEGASGQGQGQSKQRVFTGMVTKIHDNFGFIDEEVFFQMGVVKGPILPKEGDRVLVEADYNPSMPFKWNATRVQIVNMGGGGSSGGGQVSQQQQQGGYGGYSSSQKQVPPPPALSGGSRQPQQQSSVNMVANPHHASMYVSSGGGNIRGSGGGGSHVVHMSSGMDSLMGSGGGGGRQRPSQLHQDSVMSSGLMGGLPPLMPKMESGSSRDRDRDRDRKDKSRDGRGGGRSRSRSNERSRRERSRERIIRRSRTKSRERRPRGRSPSPPVLIRRSRERTERDRGAGVASSSRDRGDRSVDRDRGERIRVARSPPPIKSHKSDRVESRGKRSRSRDTIKSSEGKGSSSTHRKDKLSRSISPRRGSDNKSGIVVKSTSRYCCDPPSFSLDLLELNAADLKSRYKNLYVPSDFFLARATWMEAFPLSKPYQLSLTSSLVHIMGRRVERLEINFNDDTELAGIQQKFDQVSSVLQAPDSSCTFSVKVMILSAPSLETIFSKSGFVLETESEGSRDITTIGFQTLQRLLNFVVGVKTGKHDIMALGGKWSPSLDGPDPQSNPRVLINTAIRCCKAMASLDLTRCKYWYRFMEIYYRRSNGNLETVVYFLPDLSSCVPAQNEWDIVTKAYKVALYGAVAVGGDSNIPEPVVSASSVKQEPKKPPPKPDVVDGMDENWETGGDEVLPVISADIATAPVDVPQPVEDSTTTTCDSTTVDADATGESAKVPGEGGDTSSTLTRMEVVDEHNGDEGMDVSSQEDDTVLLTEKPVFTTPTITDVVTIKDGSGADGEMDVSGDIYDDIVEAPGADSNNLNINKSLTPGTHHSQLDLNCMTVAKLRDELALRNLNTKGLKAQLTSRLQEALDSEKEKEEESVGTGESATEPVVIVSTPVKDAEIKNEDEEVAIVRLVHPSTIFETSINEEEETGDVSLVKNDVESESSELQSQSQGQSEDQKESQSNSIIDKDEEAVLKYINVKPGGQTYPILKADMKVEEKKVWERRFALPKAPRVLLFPSSKVAASSSSLKKSVGPFDCSVMPLTSLRDYRHVDKREESFEVSLFAEFFYEMLQRDFGFRIYSEIVRQAGLIQNSDKDNESDESEAVSTIKDGEPVQKKRKTSSVPVIPGVINTPDEKDTKVKTVDPLLLLAFTFYDENHAGHITEANIEEICSALGLGLTRHEVQKLLAKVTSKGCIHYRNWTDKTETEIEGESEQSLLAEESKFNPQFMRKMAKGNKTLLPVFTYSSPIVSFDDEKAIKDEEHKEYQAGSGESVLATVDGVLIDVKRVKHQLEIAEKDKASAEANANAFQNSLTEAKNQVSELKKSSETLTQDLKKARKQVKELEASEKVNKEMIDTFKKSSESFIYRVKDIVKLPHSHSEEKKVSSVVVKKTNKDKNKDDVLTTTSSSSSGVNAATDNCVDKI